MAKATVESFDGRDRKENESRGLCSETGTGRDANTTDDGLKSEPSCRTAKSRNCHGPLSVSALNVRVAYGVCTILVPRERGTGEQVQTSVLRARGW